MKTSKHIKKIIVYSIVLAMLVIGGYEVSQKVLAQTYTGSGELTGWAWSDTIGWISFNCSNTASCSVSNYAVKVSPTTGALSGYAWSDNAGWLSFNTSDTACPDGSNCAPSVNFVNGTVTGYARFCAGTINSDCSSSSRIDGWDGWVKLSELNSTYSSPVNDGSGGITYIPSSNALVGYSWGGNNVGWIQFQNVKADISQVAIQCDDNGTLVPVGYTETSNYIVATSSSDQGCQDAHVTSTCTQSGSMAVWSPSLQHRTCNVVTNVTCINPTYSACDIPNANGTVFNNQHILCGQSMKFYINSVVQNNPAGTLTCDSVISGQPNSQVRTCNGDTGQIDGTSTYSHPVCHVNPYQKEQ